MSIPIEYQPDDRALLRWVEDVRRILLAREEGIRWEHNIGPIIRYEHDTGASSRTVRSGVTTKPLALLVLRAAEKEDDSAAYLSMPPISWSWNAGNLTIGAITGLTASTVYLVTLGLLMG